MDISTAFGVLVVVIVLLSWMSTQHVFCKLGLLLLGAWATTNIAVEWLGFTNAPAIVPSLDALFAIFVAIVGYANRSRIALVVFLLYVLVGAVHVAAFILRTQSTYSYYATLNVLFLAQLLTVGTASARMVLHRWATWSRQRLRPNPSRG